MGRNLTAEAAPYQTLWLVERGFLNSSLIPPQYPITSKGYLVAIVKLNSDKIELRPTIEVRGAEAYNLTLYLAYGTSQGIVPGYERIVKPNQSMTLEKVRLPSDVLDCVYVYIQGWVKTGESGSTTIHVTITAEPLP